MPTVIPTFLYRFVSDGSLGCGRRGNSAPGPDYGVAVATAGTHSNRCCPGIHGLCSNFCTGGTARRFGRMLSPSPLITTLPTIISGICPCDRGELDKAISHFEAASKIRSGKRDPHYNLGTAFVEMNLGDALARKGQPDEAMAHLRTSDKTATRLCRSLLQSGKCSLCKGEDGRSDR